MRPYGPRRFGEWYDERSGADDARERSRARAESVHEVREQLEDAVPRPWWEYAIEEDLNHYDYRCYLDLLEENGMVLVDCGDAYRVCTEEEWRQGLGEDHEYCRVAADERE